MMYHMGRPTTHVLPSLYPPRLYNSTKICSLQIPQIIGPLDIDADPKAFPYIQKLASRALLYMTWLSQLSFASGLLSLGCWSGLIGLEVVWVPAMSWVLVPLVRLVQG